MGEPGSDIYAELVSHIARRVELICANDLEWNYLIHHWHQSCFEFACDILWRLNLADAFESVDGKKVEYYKKEGMLPPVFKLALRT